MGSGTVTKKNPRELLALLLNLLRGEGRDLWVVVVYAIGIGICSLVIPIAAQNLVNSVAFGTLLQPVLVLSCLVGGVLIFQGILRLLQLVVVEILQRRLAVRHALYLGGKLPHVFVEQFHREYGPEYVLRFMEIFNAQKIVSILLLDGVAVSFQLLIGLIVVSFYDPYFLVFALLVIFSLSFVVVALGYRGTTSAIAESSSKYNIITWFQDVANVATLFKSSQGEHYSVKRTDELVKEYIIARQQHFSVLLRQHIGSITLQTLGNALLLLLGGVLVMEGRLTIGQLVAAELIFGNVFFGITKAGRHLEKFYDLCAAVDKLSSLANLPSEPRGGSSEHACSGPASITLAGITLTSRAAPESREHVIMRDITLAVPALARICIWGSNGSGKSALGNAIYRLTTPTKGYIEIDGRNLRDICPKDLRSTIAISRDIEFFHGSLYDNLTVGRNIDRSVVREVLKDLQLIDTVERLPAGLDTTIRGFWGPFSQGEALRLMIARAILARPRLMIIDGTLDSIDSTTVQAVLKRIKDPANPWTLIVLTHYRELLDQFDSRYLLQDQQLQPA